MLHDSRATVAADSSHRTICALHLPDRPITFGVEVPGLDGLLHLFGSFGESAKRSVEGAVRVW
jgi:hypothetical protein